jgi:hypothetical protein
MTGMASNPTGRKRGRPRKHPAKAKRPSAGRPYVPLAEDPQRWALAFLERGIRAGKAVGLTELHMIDTYVTMTRGKIVARPENLERLARDEPFYCWTTPELLPPWRIQQGPSARTRDDRYENAFRPHIDNLRTGPLRRYRNRSDDANRLRIMADIVEICLGGKRIDKARRLAASIDETEYFEERIRPHHFAYAGPLPNAQTLWEIERVPLVARFFAI